VQQEEVLRVVEAQAEAGGVFHAQALALAVGQLLGQVPADLLDGARDPVALAGGQVDHRRVVRAAQGPHAPGQPLQAAALLHRAAAHHRAAVGAPVRGAVGAPERVDRHVEEHHVQQHGRAPAHPIVLGQLGQVQQCGHRADVAAVRVPLVEPGARLDVDPLEDALAALLHVPAARLAVVAEGVAGEALAGQVLGHVVVDLVVLAPHREQIAAAGLVHPVLEAQQRLLDLRAQLVGQQGAVLVVQDAQQAVGQEVASVAAGVQAGQGSADRLLVDRPPPQLQPGDLRVQAARGSGGGVVQEGGATTLVVAARLGPVVAGGGQCRGRGDQPDEYERQN
jgi:hypothetical protein